MGDKGIGREREKERGRGTESERKREGKTLIVYYKYSIRRNAWQL